MSGIIDSHCHLSKTESFSDVFALSQKNGNSGCVLNSVTESDWNQIVKIASDNKNICGAIGIHPWFSDSVPNNWDFNMDALLRENLSLIVGEIGLDKTRDNFNVQEKVFITALEIAIKHKRTINLHCVHAWDEILKIFKIYKKDLPKIVAHSFDGTQNAIDCDLDLYFSYSPNVANPDYKKVRASVQKVPKNKILVESDSDVLLPTITALKGVLSLRDDISADDIYKNAMGVFYNG